MKDKGGGMNGIRPEDIEKAREMDLLTYLQNYEPDELVHIRGNTYCTREHDSLKISNGAWMWFSRGIGGWTALDYLIKVKGYKFTEAVKIINRQENIKAPVFSCPKPQEKKLLLPERSADNNVISKYLFERGIDLEIIRYCIKEGLIYESLPYHNVIFLGKDENRIPRYAAYRATNGSRILGDATGSDKRYSFRIMNGESESVHVFESAIDLLSFATLLKKNGMNWQSENLLSLAGVYGMRTDGASKVPAALKKYLDENEKIKTVYLHLDNDRAGRIATNGITQALENRVKAVDESPPSGKDFNDYLCKVNAEEMRKNRERKEYYER